MAKDSRYDKDAADYAVGFIECSTIAKANGHPTAAGMKTISNDIINFIKYNG